MWADGLAFTSHDVTVGVRVSDARVWPDVIERLPPAYIPASSSVDYLFSLIVGGSAEHGSIKRYHLVYQDHHRVARTLVLDEALSTLESCVRLQVAEASPTRVFVHAGVVAWNGRAMVLPGPTRAGKSRLVQALVEWGAAYASDEYAVLDADGCVHPFARPLTLREDGVQRAARVAAWSLGPVVTEPLPVAAVVLTRYEPDARWNPEPMSGAEAVMGMLENAVQARVDPARVLHALGRVAATARACRSVRGDARACAGDILRLALGQEGP